MDREDEITIEVRLLRERNHQLSEALEEARVKLVDMERDRNEAVTVSISRDQMCNDLLTDKSRLETIVQGLKEEILNMRESKY